ncbi:Histidine-tRNA ligase [Clostridium bornimense]|uniref:Histidine--tRNA ligase n=1 Tax=Clostridium bornimense TaxID=1216932 RepID=W6RZW7_9CLOT|nr:histidine--tRNA ligase [Clostridium bornimense]CDM69159.1 Histidine-tRNA ligase [Clostridium bornimense]
MAIQAPKGTKDLLPTESYKWQYLEENLRKIAHTYGCREIRTPIFESTELFLRGVGETTDVVQKEMYTFEDKGGRSVTLKPEGTSPAVRAFIESSLFNEAQPTKMYYFTPVFRYENVQKGRLRQHHQFGVEVFGAKDAAQDAEIISLAMSVFKNLGIKGLKLNINNIGCEKCRPKYNKALIEYLNSSKDDLCGTCLTRLEKNPLRILDCKVDKCKEITKNAPLIIDHVCDECKEHFEELKGYLEALGMEYTVNPFIVRGLDYYTKTVFEIINKDITVCGGGRYDRLIGEVGGPTMPAVGFGMGIERLLLTLSEEGIEIPEPVHIHLYVGSMDLESKKEALKLANKLRGEGIACEIDVTGRNLKPQMKYANKIKAAFTVILGSTEIEERKANFKRMSDGEITNISLDDIEAIAKLIKESL